MNVTEQKTDASDSFHMTYSLCLGTQSSWFSLRAIDDQICWYYVNHVFTMQGLMDYWIGHLFCCQQSMSTEGTGDGDHSFNRPPSTKLDFSISNLMNVAWTNKIIWETGHPWSWFHRNANMELSYQWKNLYCRK